MKFLFLFLYHIISLNVILAQIKCGNIQCENIQCEKIVCPNPYVEVPKLTGLCNCCNGCVLYRNLKETCRDSANPIKVTNSSLLFTSQKCYFDLECEYVNDDFFCIRDESKPCNERLSEYTEEEQKSDWFWHPACDKGGTYISKQCKEDKCFCVDKKGKRIYGTFTREEKTNCACSRLELKFEEDAIIDDKLHTGRFDHVTCQKNGNFHPLQCLRDMCFCVNETTGELTSIVVPKPVVHHLPCYTDKTSFNSLFNTPCQFQREYEERTASYYFQKEVSHKYLNPTKCNPDGTYVSKQCSSEHCMCAHPVTGNQIQTFNVPFRSRLAESMNCQCLLDMIDISTDGGNPNSFICAGNGNYRKIACHGYICYCVDTDGYRESEELDVSPWTDDFCLISFPHERVRDCYKLGYEIDCNKKKEK